MSAKKIDVGYLNKESHSKRDHKKRHKRGFNEGQDAQTARHQRINFKNYMREMEELALQDDEDDLY